MSLRMHEYSDERTGLAAFCDTCGEQITENDGWIVWNADDPGDMLVVHQARCDPGNEHYMMNMPLDVEIVYLARSAGMDLKVAADHANTFGMLVT